MTCNSDGNTNYKPTWAVETNYYMDLGFLPQNMQYFSISGRAGWYGTKGDSNGLPALSGPGPVLHRLQDRIQQRTDPSDLRRLEGGLGCRSTRTSSIVWVAYRYWQNKFGLDHNAHARRLHRRRHRRQSTNACTESVALLPASR